MGPVYLDWDWLTGDYFAAALLAHVGNKAASRLLDGRTHDEFPEMR